MADGIPDLMRVVTEMSRRVDAQMKCLDDEIARTGPLHPLTTAVATECAKLVALSARETWMAQSTVAGHIANVIQDFGRVTDQSTKRLAKWTMWLAIVTGLLVLAAFVQVLVTWSAAPLFIPIPPGP